MVVTAATTLLVANSASAACPVGQKDVGLYTSTLNGGAGQPGAPSLAQTETIQFADVNGDGEDDLCYATHGTVRCHVSTSACSFSHAHWITFSVNIENNPKYADTLAFPDVNGDGHADACVRVQNGIECALGQASINNNGIITTGFSGKSTWSNNYRDSFGWGAEKYYSTIEFVDLDNDGKDDVCGRGGAGMVCGISDGTQFVDHGVITHGGQFSDTGQTYGWIPGGSEYDATPWASSEHYYGTIQFGDINNDGLTDVCGRGKDGIYCATYNDTTETFQSGHYWTKANFSDAANWKHAQYASTIRLGDINGDGDTDVCGRGGAGMYCGLSDGSGSFTGVNSVAAPFFGNASMGTPQRYETIVLTDTNGDGADDICGRGPFGIYCAIATGNQSGPMFQGVTTTWINNFGDNFGWGSAEVYWGTVQPANADSMEDGTEFCGRGNAGIYCSAN